MRFFLSVAILLASGLAAPVSAQVRAGDIETDPLIVTGGQIAGSVSASGIRSYLGIPFAAPPVRDLRWRPPVSPPAWSGVRQAVTYPPMCPQGMRGPGQNHYFGAEPTSEDCLYLNLWSPSAGPEATPRPVVVWIYGGGFSGGSASMMWARGEHLAERGVISISLNYRVGALGFMAHPELTSESERGASGNYGHLDQVAALRWIQANIAAFGGDPTNVTVIGQSAGSMSISALQASPLAAGLFQKAIGLSGNVVGTGAGAPMSAEAAEAAGVALQTALGVENIDDMRNLPADRIVGLRGIRIGPSIDGYFMPRNPREIYAAGEANDVALFIGFTRDEAFSSLGSAEDAAGYQTIVRQTYPEQADEFLIAYPADNNWARNARDAARDVSLGISTRDWAAMQATQGRRPAFGYMFSRVHPYASGIAFTDHEPASVGAYHAGDIVYWFGNLDAFNAFRTTRDWSDADRALSDTMSSMVVAFATTGDPSVPGAPVPTFNPADARLIELGDRVGVIPWPGRDNFEFLSRIRPAQPPSLAPSQPGTPAANLGPRF